MNKSIQRRTVVLCISLCIGLFFSQCKDYKQQVVVPSEELDFSQIAETPVSGQTNILVEESIFPIVEDLTILFEHEYSRAKVDLVQTSQAQALHLLLNDSIRIAVLPRTLNEEEMALLEGRVVPKQTHFASDAIVFVANKSFQDSIVDYQKIIKNLQRKSSSLDQGMQLNQEIDKDPILVFDSYNSAVSSFFRQQTNSEDFPKDYAYFLANTQEVIDYVNKTPNAIGVIGLNWLTQPSEDIEKQLKNVKVLGVKNPNDGKYYKATQNNIATKDYPLTRDLYIIDLQGKNGLGLGFASYIAGYKGQRVVLKSGLVPFKTPTRELVVRQSL
ncbi:PstS family phosphate ABC transporter substrate-binding protein [Myroides sp. LJL115]